MKARYLFGFKMKLLLSMILVSMTIASLSCEDQNANYGSLIIKIELSPQSSNKPNKQNNLINNFNVPISKKDRLDIKQNLSIRNIKITAGDLSPVNIVFESGTSTTATIDNIPTGNQSVKVELQNKDKTTIFQEEKSVIIVENEIATPTFDNFKIVNESIVITKPSGGETFEGNQSLSIEWVGSHEKIPVSIDLFQGNSKSITIIDNYNNNGQFSFTIPSSTSTASDYKIKITSTSNTSVFDESQNFTINSPYTFYLNDGFEDNSSVTWVTRDLYSWQITDSKAYTGNKSAFSKISGSQTSFIGTKVATPSSGSVLLTYYLNIKCDSNTRALLLVGAEDTSGYFNVLFRYSGVSHTDGWKDYKSSLDIPTSAPTPQIFYWVNSIENGSGECEIYLDEVSVYN